jgi:hypothetical protein
MILYTLIPPHLMPHLSLILSLLVQEFQQLGVGVPIHDSYKRTDRQLKGFLLRAVTDMVARKEVIRGEECKERG